MAAFWPRRLPELPFGKCWQSRPGCTVERELTSLRLRDLLGYATGGYVGPVHRSSCQLLERFGPSAVLVNEFVDFVHQTPGIGEGCDDLLIVADIRIGENTALSVLKPSLRRAVAANGEIPDFRFDALEVLFAIDPSSPGQFAARRRVSYLVHAIAAAIGEPHTSVNAFVFH